MPDLNEYIAWRFIGEADLEYLYDQFHIIARYYHWGRMEIKTLPSKERLMWVNKIIDHEKMLNSDGKEESGGDLQD